MIRIEWLAQQAYDKYHNDLWWYSRNASSPDYTFPDFFEIDDIEHNAWIAVAEKIKDEVIKETIRCLSGKE